MIVAKYRKIPVVIEAVHLTLANRPEAAVWCGGEFAMSGFSVDIPTLEGTMSAQIGDWIIKGVADEFYPCKPEIFAKTYEYVERIDE